MIASMRPRTGRVAVVMPLGVLFRAGVERGIRECLVEGGLLRALIRLPKNLFYSTPIPACILIFGDAEAGRPVRMVDASKRFTKGRNQNVMGPEDIEAVVAAVKHAQGAERLAVRDVTIDELIKGGWDLTPNRYLDTESAGERSVAEVIMDWQSAVVEAAVANDALAARLKESGYA